MDAPITGKPGNTPASQPGSNAGFFTRLASWAKAHKLNASLISLAGVIGVAVAIVLITGQRISILGVQLNPMAPKAICFDDGSGQRCNPPAPPEMTIEGDFKNGQVNTPYNTTLTLTEAPDATCSWNLVSITPAMEGATVTVPYASPRNTNHALFTATPKKDGHYRVTVSVTCNTVRRTMPQQTFDWTVDPVHQPPILGDLSISGDFPSAVVNQAYSATVRTVNGNRPNYTCALSLDSINPAMRGATVTPNKDQSGEAVATFAVIPQASGTFVVKIRATCNPVTGDAPSLTATQDFNLVVGLAQGNKNITITADFPDSAVNQSYTTVITTTANTIYTCEMSIARIQPSIAGAKLTPLNQLADPRAGIFRAQFQATPTQAANYVVSIHALCNPNNGSDIPSIQADQDFNWHVTGSSGGGGGGGSGGGGGGTANVCTNPALANKLIPVYRWWKAADSDHFFTTNANERPTGYHYEGIAGYVYNEQVTNSTPVYRSYNHTLTAHYYSTVDDAANYGYTNEGIIGYAYTGSREGTFPWFRLHKGWPFNDYLETISNSEKTAAMNIGYLDEGTAAYICGPDRPQ